jgi:hypothetical protein
MDDIFDYSYYLTHQAEPWPPHWSETMRSVSERCRMKFAAADPDMTWREFVAQGSLREPTETN